MSRIIFILAFTLLFFNSLYGQYKVAGRLVNSTGRPIALATIVLSGHDLWSVSNDLGEFTINHIPEGKISLSTHCLGYAKKTIELDIKNNIQDLIIELEEDNLKLEEVVVTAQRKTGDLTTSYLINRAAIDHAQVLNITDISSLLPGGKTALKYHLAQENDDRFSLRSKASEKGNASFATAIEIDGIRLDNNAVMSTGIVKSGSSATETKGVSTRNISTTNIESVEIITGIPSVEYGDLSNGMVKINTRKGKTPYYIELSTKPNTKQLAISKGFLLGAQSGALNLSFERTKSNSDIASPHTTYTRNAFSVSYSNAFSQGNKKPLTLTAGISGNIGGYDAKADPDAFKEQYKKYKDNTIRANFKLNWLINQPWITHLELSGSVNYSDKLHQVNDNKNSVSSQAAIHGTEAGYFLSTRYEDNPEAPIVQGPSGYWYELQFTDNKPLSYALKLKASWVKKLNAITNRILVGAEYNSSTNKGKGVYYDQPRYTPTWRAYAYKDLPAMHNLALYAEEKLTIPVNPAGMFQLTAGLRSDLTFINESEYGAVNSLSPRFNAKYTFWENAPRAVSRLSLHAGWGKAVKLPSFEVLYPKPSYTDILSFTHNPGKGSDILYGYYIIPERAIYNPNLKWQQSRQTEIGLEATILGAKVTVSAYHNKTLNPYIRTNAYTPFTYKLTRTGALENNPIASDNRVFAIDRVTGIVTVSDQSGTQATQQLAYDERNTYQSNSQYTNGTPIHRKGVEWTIDLPPVKALRTSFRLDGNYYYYKGVEETLIASYPGIYTNMADGNPYQFIGYYTGANNTTSPSAANGSLSKEVNSNLTITTHIPKIRLIISMRLEASFYRYSRYLSESQGKPRGFVWDSELKDYFNSDTDIYGGNRQVAVYPQYYSTWENPHEKLPFIEQFTWAKDNDAFLFNELKKLVLISSYKTTFNSDKISAYFSANLNVTKEIGNFATLSFFANNFLNSLARIKSSKEDTEFSLYNSGYIPKFYYGLSLKFSL